MPIQWCLVLYLQKRFQLSPDAFAVVLFFGMALCIIIPYLLGSINSGIIISRMFFHDDVRKHGSGNAGTTNVLRTYGKKYAALTFVGDTLKAAVCMVFGYFIFQSDGAALAGFFCIIGHMFPLYYHFRGGKGIACTAMIVLLTDPITFVLLLICFLVIVVFTRFVSLASVMCMLLYPMVLYAFRPDGGLTIVMALLTTVFVVFMHRENIKRLYEGTESKLSFRRDPEVNRDAAGEDNGGEGERRPSRQERRRLERAAAARRLHSADNTDNTDGTDSMEHKDGTGTESDGTPEHGTPEHRKPDAK